MDGRVKTIADALNGPHSGIFKPTHKLGGLLGLEGHKDFVYMDSTTDKSIRPSASDVWSKYFSENALREDTILYGVRSTETGRFFKTHNPFLTIIGFPAARNQEEGYSIDVRVGRGTAHFAVDVFLGKSAEEVYRAIEQDPSLLNEALVLTQWSNSHIPFSPYEQFIARGDIDFSRARALVGRGGRLEDAQTTVPTFKVKSI